MGQAKQRGTFEQRKALAIEREKMRRAAMDEVVHRRPSPTHMGRTTSLIDGSPVPADQPEIYQSAEIERLRAALRIAAAELAEAAEDVQSWGDYAAAYFQDKHGLRANVEQYEQSAQAALRAAGAGIP